MVRIEAAGHVFTVEETDVHLREQLARDARQPDVTFPRLEGWKALSDRTPAMS